MTPNQPSQAVGSVVEALESCTVGGYRDIDGDWCERLHFDKEKVMLALSALRAELARPQEVAVALPQDARFLTTNEILQALVDELNAGVKHTPHEIVQRKFCEVNGIAILASKAKP